MGVLFFVKFTTIVWKKVVLGFQKKKTKKEFGFEEKATVHIIV